MKGLIVMLLALIAATLWWGPDTIRATADKAVWTREEAAAWQLHAADSIYQEGNWPLAAAQFCGIIQQDPRTDAADSAYVLLLALRKQQYQNPDPIQQDYDREFPNTARPLCH